MMDRQVPEPVRQTPAMDKRTLRRENFARINALTPGEKADHSEALVRHLRSHPAFVAADTVFSYAAMKSEPDLSGLRSGAPGKTWALSRVADDGESLRFHRVTTDQSLIRSPFGFDEPDPHRCPVITGADLILLPGVGFDPVTGARLGRGKGHYDRFLKPLMDSSTPPVLIGVCFSTQLTSLHPERHDIPVHFLATEQGILRCSST